MSMYNMYITEGIWDLVWAFVPSVIVYLLWSLILWVTKKRKFTDIKNLPVKKMIAEFLLIWYFLAILGITGIRAMILEDRFGIDDYTYTYFSFIPFVGASMMMVILNVLLFVPYGFLLPMAKKNCNKKFWKWALLIGFLTSLCIEVTQYFGGRMSEIDDLIANTWGTLLGYFLWESLHYIYLGEQRNKYIIKGISAILSTLLALYGVSFITNINIVHDEYYNLFVQDKDNVFYLYSDMGIRDEEINDIDKIVVFYQNSSLEIKAENEFDDIIYWYESIGIDISNNASVYNQTSCNYTTEEIVSGSDDIFLEVFFHNTHDFSFYNNHDIEILNVSHMLYNLDNGTAYFGDSDKILTTQLIYVNKEYPYVMDSEIYSDILKAVK